MLYSTLLRVTDTSQPWSDRYPDLAEEAKEVIRRFPSPMATREVVKALLAGLTKEQADPHTTTLYNILAALAKHDLKEWVKLGDKMTRGFGGRMAYPRLWASPYEEPTPTTPAAAAPARPIVQEAAWWALGKWMHRHIADLTEEQRQSCEAVMRLMQEVNEEMNTHD